MGDWTQNSAGTFRTRPRDLEDVPAVGGCEPDQLEVHGACALAQGKSAIGVSEAEYTRFTHDFPLAAFKAFNDAKVRGEDGTFRFVYISGERVDQEEKSRVMFSRVKVRLAFSSLARQQLMFST